MDRPLTYWPVNHGSLALDLGRCTLARSRQRLRRSAAFEQGGEGLMAGRGAPLVDADCTGTAIRDFVSVADESRFDEQAIIDVFGPPPADAMLVFE